MTLIKLIVQYLTNPKFRSYIDSIMALANNKNGITDEVDRQIAEFKKQTKTRLTTRIDELNDVTTMIRVIPGSGIILSKLNYLMNELKEDLRRID